MDVAPANSLERIFSRRSLVRGHARTATFWSVAATLSLFLLLLDLSLVVGLVVDRGRLELNLSRDEVARFERITGLKVAGSPVDAKMIAPRIAEQDFPEKVHVYYDEHGILPAVWRTRHFLWGSTVAFLYRRVSWLQMNVLALIWLLSIGVLLLVFRSVCLVRLRVCSHRVAIEGVSTARRNLHRQVLRLGPEDLDGSGQLLATRLFTEELEVVRRGAFEFVSRSVRYPLELTGLLLVLLSLDWRLALQWIAPLALGLLFLDGIRQKAIKNRRLAEDRSRGELKVLLASFQNARLIRGLGIEQAEHDQFQKHLERYHSQLAESSRATEAINRPHSTIVISCAFVGAFLLFLLCSNVVALESATSTTGMTIAEGLTFIAAIVAAIPGVFALKSLPEIRRESSTAADSVQRFLDRVPTVSQAVGAKFLQPMAKTLHFENVKFQTASGRKILDGVDFKLEVDKCYAVVSPNPLEAKAIALMLPRFIEPREGRVMIDGEDIAWVTLESLRAETVFVAADDPPFEGTVLENIRAGQSGITLQQATEAAKLTHAHNFIVKLYNGYETVLTSQGESLDAGQRFRLGLARALVRNPALLVIEEPGVPLDEDTKTLLIDAYDRICRERTVIFLPTRMSTVRRSDQIVVLHEGKVAAMGPHSKLVTQSPIYRHWEYLNFNEFRHEGENSRDVN